MSASEAIHRIYGYKLHGEKPNVVALDVHLKDKQFMVFDSKKPLQEVLTTDVTTTLTAWLVYNCNCSPDEPSLGITYREMPKFYTFSKKKWSRRVHQSDTIGRVHLVNPKEGERYYLRHLLNHVTGPKCFNDIKTY